MIVISLTDCPPALRGDLSKWLQEISTGVYVGKVSKRVRDELWTRVKENIRTGRATMVYSTNNEQGMDFLVHNSGWTPIEFDGLKLMLRPIHAHLPRQDGLKAGFSKAAKIQSAKRFAQPRRSRISSPERYVVLDLETTGLSASNDAIIEIGAIRVEQGEFISQFHSLIKPERPVPPTVLELTGLTESILLNEGKSLSQVLPDLLSFIGDLPIVSHNVNFETAFLRSACDQNGLQMVSNRSIDTLNLARKLIKGIPNYKLSSVMEYFDIDLPQSHRSIDDCIATKKVFEKLIKMG